MGLERQSSRENNGKVRKEPRLFPTREEAHEDGPADAPTIGATSNDTVVRATKNTIEFPDFKARLRTCILLAWLLPPAFTVFLLQYLELYSASDMMLVLKRFGLAYIAICTAAASLLLTRYAGRIARTVADAADPDTIDWSSVQTRLKRFQWVLLASFATYCILGPFIADLVLGHAHGKALSVEEHIFSLLATVPGVIVTAIPVFFRLSDLIGAFFAERGGAFIFVSVGAKVAALGLLMPLMISTALFVYYRDRTGFFSMEAVAVCAVLLVAAGIGTYIAWNSFRHSLAPLRAPLRTICPGDGLADPQDDVAMQPIPHSLDEIGLLVRGWAQLSEHDRMHHRRTRAREEQIRMITDSLPALIAYVDSDERFQFVNERYREWWQVEPGDLIGKSLSEFLPPELYRTKTPRIAAALAGIETSDLSEFVYPDGKRRICEVRYVPHKSDTGAVLGYFALISDVTEQKNVEQAAQKAHQRLLDAIESLPAGFSLYDKDERLVISNSYRRNMTTWHGDLLAPGVAFEELLRNSATTGSITGVDKHGAAEIEAFLAQRLEDFRNPVGKPIEVQRNDGTTMMSLFHKTSDGGTVSIALDITEQKRAEQAAQTADQRLREAIESMPSGFRIFDENERLVLWNSKYMEQTRWHGGHIEAGITFEEILKKTVANRGWLDNVDHDDSHIRDRLAEFRAAATPFEVSRADGKHFVHIYRKTAEGGTVAVMHEVTEQKQAEKQAERERRRLLDSINSLPIGFRLYDQDDRLVFSNNQNHSDLHQHREYVKQGATYENILRDSVAKGLHVHDMENDEAYIDCKMREFRNSDGKPIERRRSDGRIGLMLFRKTSDGETASIALDITEQKEAETHARKSHQRLYDAVESLPVGFRLFDADERLVLFNSIQKQTTEWHGDLLKPGVTYEEILRDSVNKGIHLHDLPDNEDYIAHRLNLFRNGHHAPIECHYATGRHAISVYRKTSDGGTVTIEMDVTERVEAENSAQEANQRLVDAIECLPAGFCLFNKNEQLVINNSRQRETTPWHGNVLRFGTTFEELVRSGVEKEIYGGLDYDDPAAVEEFITARLADFRNPQGASAELSRVNGTAALKVFHQTSNGGTVSVTLDITELKQAEQALKASEARLNAILDLAPEAIITMDEDNRIQLFNSGAQRLFGYAAEDVFGKNIETLFARQTRIDRAEAEGKSIEPGLSVWQADGRTEMIARHESGREFPVKISVAETAADGARLHTVLLQDISEHKRWEEEIRQTMQLADEANRAKSEFLSHMSHELRTPLNGILGYAEFIQGKWLGDDALDQYTEYAGFIHKSGQHLLQLINDILDLSKVEAGHYEVEIEEIDIGDLFKECQLIVATDAENKRIAIDFDIESGSERWTADRRALKQILINLLSNALKFSDAEAQIHVGAARDGKGHYRLDVRDTGIGMTEEESQRALEPFVQVSSPYVSQQKGTGLGLALVVRLAALHGGTVEIKSRPRAGTTVHVTFPPLPRDASAIATPGQISA